MTTVPPVPSPRPAEEIQEARLPALLARLRAAEETLAAVGALCVGVGIHGSLISREAVRVALAEGASR